MAKPMQLRCQFGGGQRKPIVGLTSESSVDELRAVLFSVTEIAPHRQRIKSGYPPKTLETTNDTTTLQSLGIRSGDTLIVEEIKGDGECSQPKTNSSSTTTTATPSSAAASASKRKMVRKIVPADNSCLFASISFVMLQNTSFADDLRLLAANSIASDPITYTDAFLGKPNWEYCEWLTKKDHWGGAIELNVFSQHYQTEINAVDVQSGRIDRFGEGNAYPNRVFVMYDGIHYDPMGLVEKDGGQIIKTVFPTDDASFQAMALQVADELKKGRQFTDLSGFSLRCMVCNTPLKGQTQAQQHAKETGHMNFGEV